MKKQKVVCIWGAQGTGKTNIAVQIERKDSMYPCTIIDDIRPRMRLYLPYPKNNFILVSKEKRTLENFCKRHDLVPTQWIHT